MNILLQGSVVVVFEYVSKFIIGGCILALATYFSKSKNIFLSGVITILPIMTLANLILQTKFLNKNEFQSAQKAGIFGAFGAVLFLFSVFLLAYWMKPLYAILLAICIYIVYFLVGRLLLFA
ncbi:hypothetical protein [Ectobacillus sp. sgz5001026]|uniref:hypothetical protein n=1 Tax=Ectobacillus sp. sgz5001026 TaxID=3242473 RepID=UPI0036D22C8A